MAVEEEKDGASAARKSVRVCETVTGGARRSGENGFSQKSRMRAISRPGIRGLRFFFTSL